MTDHAAEFPDLPPELRRGASWRLLVYFGPGAIIACVTIGSGETVFASRGGAIYGYAMLWCFVAGALCKAIQVYSAARFITLTGRGPLQSWMELPGPRGWFVWFVAIMTIVWMPFWLAGLPQMLGDFSNWVVGIPKPREVPGFANLSLFQQQEMVRRYETFGRCWATLYIVVAIAITWLQSYGFLEKVQTAIVGLLLFCMALAVIVTGPDWMAMLKGMVPHAPHYDPWVLEKVKGFERRSPWVEVMVYMGVIGGGTQDYLGYIGMLREKAWGLLGCKDQSQVGPPPKIAEDAENIARGKTWLWPARIDVGVSFAAVLVFTLCFLVLGAEILQGKSVPNGFDLLTEQARFLEQLAENSSILRGTASWIYKTGIFFAFFGTILGAYEIFTRTIHESAIALVPRLHAVPLRKFRFWTLVYCGCGGLVLLWFLDAAVASLKIDPVMIVTPAALVGSGLICGLWCFAMLWSDRAHLPRALRMPAAMQVGLVLAGLVLTVAPLIGLVEFISGLAAKHS